MKYNRKVPKGVKKTANLLEGVDVERVVSRVVVLVDEVLVLLSLPPERVLSPVNVGRQIALQWKVPLVDYFQ